MEKESAMSLRDYLVIISKRRWIIILAVVSVAISTFLFIPKTVSIYTAYVTIMLEQPAEVSPLLRGLAPLLRSTEIATQAKLIKSRSLAEEVVKVLRIKMLKAAKVRGEFEEWSDPEAAVLKIQNSISVEHVEDTDLLKISVRDTDPCNAMDIANTVAKVFVAQSLKSRTKEIQSASRFIENQLAVYKRKLQESEDALYEFKAREGYITLEREMAKLDAFETQYIDTKLNREIDETRLETLKAQLTQRQKAAVPSLGKIQSAVVRDIVEKIEKLELKRAMLLRDYTEKHPKVIEVKRQVEEMVTILKEEAARFMKEKGGAILDPWSEYQNMMDEALSLEIAISTARIREQTLTSLVEGYSESERLDKLAGKKAELLRLERGVSANEKQYSVLVNRLSDIHIAESMETGNIRIVDPAVLPKKPDQPKKMGKIAIGGFIGLIVGVGLVFLFENLDTSLKTIEDVRHYLNLPVVGIIPRILTKEERERVKPRAWKRKRPEEGSSA